MQFSHELNQKIKLDYTAQIVKFLIRSGALLFSPGNPPRRGGVAVALVRVVNLYGSQWRKNVLPHRHSCHSDKVIFAPLHFGLYALKLFLLAKYLKIILIKAF